MGVPPPIQLANLGMADSLILMVLALVVFGPRRLPQIGRQIGKLMYEFRKASNDFKFQMEEELRLAEEADRRKKEEEERQRAAALVAASQASVSAPRRVLRRRPISERWNHRQRPRPGPKRRLPKRIRRQRPHRSRTRFTTFRISIRLASVSR